jgi:hypothetical protein
VVFGTFDVPYEKRHHIFSLVILTLNASFRVPVAHEAHPAGGGKVREVPPQALAVLLPPATGALGVPGAIGAATANAPLQLGGCLRPPARVLLQAVEEQALEIRWKLAAEARGGTLGPRVEVMGADLDRVPAGKDVGTGDEVITDRAQRVQVATGVHRVRALDRLWGQVERRADYGSAAGQAGFSAGRAAPSSSSIA